MTDDYAKKLEAQWEAEEKLYALPATNDTLPFLFLPKIMTESFLTQETDTGQRNTQGIQERITHSQNDRWRHASIRGRGA